MTDILPELDDEQFLKQCYFYYLKRSANEEGMRHFLTLLASGTTRVEIIKAFVSSPEYLTLLNQGRVLNPSVMESPWIPYELNQVVDVAGPQMLVRTYTEQKDFRRNLVSINNKKGFKRAVEFGCGFGRMTLVLTEFDAEVVGIEREPLFVERARQLIPEVTFHQVDDLSSVPIADGWSDLIVTFTFLQHLINEQAQNVIMEMKRCLKQDGFILICEETDESHIDGEIDNPLGQCAIGRSVEQYCEYFKPLRLVSSSPRKVEPGYSREDTGTYMLFNQ